MALVQATDLAVFGNTTRSGTEHLAAPAPFRLDTLETTHKYLPIRSLKVNKVHYGSYVILQVCSVDMKMTAVFATTQDQHGDTVRFSLYNFISPIAFYCGDASWALRAGVIFVLVEPFLKVAQDGGIMLRCDNPSHVTWMDECPRRPLWRSLKWRTPLAGGCANGDDPHHFKQLGNDAFQRSDFSAAAKFYTRGLNALSGPDAVLVTLLSNRSEAFLKMQHHRLALRDAGLALEVDASHVKSMYRKARAQLNLNLFSEALSQVKKGLALDPGNSALVGVHVELTRRVSVPRSAAEIDFPGMMQAVGSHAGGEVRLMWPDYSGPIEVKDTCGDRGRGTFATETLRPGQVILVEKPLAVTFPGELQEMGKLGNRLTLTNLDSDDSFRAAVNREITWRLVEACRSSAKTNAAVESLYAGCKLTGWRTAASASRIVDLDEPLSDEAGKGGDGSGVIDVGHVEAMQAKFNFGLQTLHDVKQSKVSDRPATYGSGVWYQAGFINHSCQPNCNQFNIGDMMAISVVEEIDAGEEVTVAYVPVMDDISVRTRYISYFGFTCRCSLCQLEKKAERRTDVLAKRYAKIMEKLTSQSGSHVRKEALRRLRALEEELVAMKPAAGALLWRVRSRLSSVLHDMGDHRRGVEAAEASLDALRCRESGRLFPTTGFLLGLNLLAQQHRVLGNLDRAGECDRTALDEARKMFGNADAVVEFFLKE